MLSNIVLFNRELAQYHSESIIPSCWEGIYKIHSHKLQFAFALCFAFIRVCFDSIRTRWLEIKIKNQEEQKQRQKQKQKKQQIACSFVYPKLGFKNASKKGNNKINKKTERRKRGEGREKKTITKTGQWNELDSILTVNT